MAFAKISQVAHYAPEQIITNEDLAQVMDTSDEWISSRTGIKERHISKTESTGDLATEVARQLLDKAGISAEELDFIILATMTPDSMMPSTAARVQARIGAHKAFAYDLTAACSGFVFALSTAEKFISSGTYRKECLTYGQTGLVSPFSIQEEPDVFLKMDGRAVFDFAIRDVAKSIKQTIEKSPISADELDYLLLHQANIRILDKMARKIGVDRDKLPANMMKYGNTSAASIPILLSECVEEGLIHLDGSQKILLSGFGGGLTWGTLIVTI